MTEELNLTSVQFQVRHIQKIMELSMLIYLSDLCQYTFRRVSSDISYHKHVLILSRYILMQVPSNLFLNNIGKPALYLPTCMIIWVRQPFPYHLDLHKAHLSQGNTVWSEWCYPGLWWPRRVPVRLCPKSRRTPTNLSSFILGFVEAAYFVSPNNLT